MATMNIENKIVAFGDVAQTNNPRLRYVDWYRNVQGISVETPRTEAFALNPGETVTVAGSFIAPSPTNTVDSSEVVQSRTKLYGAFGDVVVSIDSLVSITVKANGTVDFKVPSSSTLDDVAPGHVFYVKGYSTLDGSNTPINQINEGLWKVVRKETGSSIMTCQKICGCTGAISQGSDTSPLGTLTLPLVVSTNLIAQEGNYLAFDIAGSGLYEILYSDAERIDVGLLPFEVPDGTGISVATYKCSFVYIESNGAASVAYQMSFANYEAPVVPVNVSGDERVGWLQLTANMNFVSVTNTDSIATKVTAVLGG